MIKHLARALRAAVPRATPAAFDVAGVGCLVAAAFTFTTAAGLIALGIALPVLGWRFDQ